MTVVDDEEMNDLLPESLSKGSAAPLVRTAKQQRAAEKRAEAAAREADLAEQNSRAKEAAARLAQVVNLHIAGFSLADIGASIGASEAEVDRMISADTARYVKTQPALRTYVRNWISGRYTALLDAVWDEATDKTHKEKLEHQDRALRILDRMARLHGAEMPTQSEVKLDAAPEAVDRLVQRLAQGGGFGYDMTIFDVVPGAVVHEAAEEAHRAELVSGDEVEDEQPGDSPL